MADDTPTFRMNHLVRLRGFNHAALDSKLARVTSLVVEANGKFEVAFLDDSARPPVPTVPARSLQVKPEHMGFACEYCLVTAAAAEGGDKLQMCGKCKTAHYCNAVCQHADWARHRVADCTDFALARGVGKPFHLACVGGRLLEVRRMVEEEGVDVNKTTTNGPTPLFLSATGGHLEIVQYLVGRGASLEKVNNDGVTPLFGAAQEGQLAVVRYMVEQGADKEKAANDGITPLIAAASRGHLAVVRYLVEQGADKEKANNSGVTPLNTAADEGHLAVVRYLVEQGANKDPADNKGWTPLNTAAFEGHLAIVRYLVEQGANKDKANVDGATPLYAAATSGHLAIVRCVRL